MGIERFVRREDFARSSQTAEPVNLERFRADQESVEQTLDNPCATNPDDFAGIEEIVRVVPVRRPLQ